ncbi:serine hydrolase domain-containing protein [Agromyces sp. NPDC057865]|uniref:serine hydrolase domain-containing protein n=1 Tax=Agromyces sp. NPDC057865 TaxID=3346267 RepID=UPI00366FD4F8
MPIGAETVRAVEELFAQRVREERSPGSAWALFDRDGVAAAGGLGAARLAEARTGDESPVDGQRADAASDAGALASDADVLFRVASCTKSFTAAALLLLRDRGAVDLDAPVRAFVPEFAPEVPGGLDAPVSVRMLMTMSGGLPTDDAWADREESMTRDAFRRVLAAGIRCVTVPGTAYEYSNVGYALLGQVVEAVSGDGYAEFVERELIAPLGLDARFAAPTGDSPAVAIGYRRGPDGWIGLQFTGPGVFSAIGGVFASARSLAAWAGWLASGWRGDEAGPLSAASRRELQQLHRVAPPRSPAPDDPTPMPAPLVHGYGYGLVVEHDARFGPVLSHSGGYPGFSAHMRWHAASGLGVVALENATYAKVSRGAEAALERLLLDADAVESLRTPIVPWPETLRVAEGLGRLAVEWSDAAADELLATNVALDLPYAERRAAIDSAWDAVGGRAGERATAEDVTCDSPDHLVWFLRGAAGRLRLETRLTPLVGGRAQTFIVAVEGADPQG